MSIDPDRELVECCQTLGSQEFEVAFEQLYDRYKDRVYGLSYRITGNSTDALDAAQEAFILLYQKIGSFKFDSKFSSWLYRLVVNASIDHLRRSRTRRSEPGSSLSSSTTSPSGSRSGFSNSGSSVSSQMNSLGGRQDPLQLPSDPAGSPRLHAETQDQADAIQIGIDQLSDKLKVITVLRYQQNLSYDEIGEVLEISPGTVKSRLSRAHAALRKHLAHLNPGANPRANPEARGPLGLDEHGGDVDPKGGSRVS